MGRKRAKRRPSRRDQSSDAEKAATGRIASRRPVDASPRHSRQSATFLAAGLIALATVVAFCNSFTGPFVFDDEFAIVENPTIRQLWPLSKALCPPNHGESVTGRPLLNVSLAVNYAISQLNVWSYHVANLAIHLLGSLLLFGILRRTFLLPVMRERWGAAATPLAFVIALLWAIHPLQTESVTYMIQRAESLVGLFYLLTLYCFIRGVESTRSFIWHSAAAIACLLGMASKEVMVSAPLIVLLYDRTFLAGSFGEAWRRRGGFYMALAGTWLLLGWLVISAGDRGGSAGFGVGISWWAYLCTQFGAIIHYVWLCVWPHPLLLDYGNGTAQGVLEIVPYAIVLGLLGVATVVALWRWPKVGFLGAWFFAILAPTSSVVPVVTETIAEHRMYLPLAAVVTGLVIGGYFVGQRLVRSGIISLRASQLIGSLLALSTAVALGTVTLERNADYRSELLIWQDTAHKSPANARVLSNYGMALFSQGQIGPAIANYRKALEIKPDYAEAHNNLGIALAGCGQTDEAIAHFREALKIAPDLANTHNSLGNALAVRGQFGEAIAHFHKALEINPDLANAYNNLANALASRGQLSEAISHYQKALRIQPDYAEPRYNLGNVLAICGRLDEAIAQYQQFLKINPNHALAHNNLGNALASRGRLRESIAHYRIALDLNFDNPNAYKSLAWVLATCPEASLRNGNEAVALAERAVILSGSREPAILDTLAAAYAEAGRFPEAVETAQKAIDLATQQHKTALAESIKAKLHLYEAKKPFREISGR